MRSIIAEVSVAEDKEAAFYAALTRFSGEGVDITGMLNQYGSLAVQLLAGAKSADELYAALTRMDNLNTLQANLEEASALSAAAKAIDPSDSTYDPLKTLDAYILLEAEYEELAALQRGSEAYLLKAKALTEATTASVYQQAAAYGIVQDIQAKSAQYAASADRDKKFKDAGDNNYAGGVKFLSDAVKAAETAGTDVTEAWNDALSDLDDAGVLSDMIAMFGDISGLAEECGGNVEQIIQKLNEMRSAAQDVSLSDMASDLQKKRGENRAATDSYQDQVDSLTAAFGDGGTEGVARAMEVWNGFDSALQQSIAETYPSLVIALDEANKAADELADGVSDLEGAEDDLSDASKAAQKRVAALGKELKSAQKSANARYFKNTAKSIEDLRHGTKSVTEAFSDYNAEAEKAVKANEEYQAASKKMAAGTEVTAEE